MFERMIEKLRHTGDDIAASLGYLRREQIEPEFLKCSCPKCCSKDLELIEIHENEIEHAFCVFKCLDCGSSFIVWEDYINFCRRAIQNAENEIEFQSEKVKFYNRLLQYRK